MQKSPRIPLRSEFEELAKINEDLIIKRRVDQLPQREQDNFFKAVKQANRSIDEFFSDLAEERKDNIRFEKQAILDRDISERDLELKPKNQPMPSFRELDRQAQEQAEAKVAVDEQRRFDNAVSLATQNLCDHLEQLEIKAEHMRMFSESSRPEGPSKDNSKEDFER